MPFQLSSADDMNIDVLMVLPIHLRVQNIIHDEKLDTEASTIVTFFRIY
jgi:hypothetical protein